jgi:large subunit ribosomal protein L5
VVSKLSNEFNTRTSCNSQKIEKVVINKGLGEAIQNIKVLDSATAELTAIAGQKLCDKSKEIQFIARFKLRQGIADWVHGILRR